MMFKPDTCRNGHERTAESTRLTPSGQRYCVVCRDIARAERREGPNARAHTIPEPEHRSEIAGHAISYRCLVPEPEAPIARLGPPMPFSPPFPAPWRR